jgi:translation initiation factor 6 (eIF-6)
MAMKAWRVTNKITGHYTESTTPITIKRELLNVYGRELKETDLLKVLEMSIGEVSTIGDLEIICKNSESPSDKLEIEELRQVEMKLASQIDCYEDELKKVLSKYFTDEMVSMIMKDLEAD